MLDHCARAKAAGVGGIKALVIYPDECPGDGPGAAVRPDRRSTPAFKGLRVGLFIGGQQGKDGTGWSIMTATNVITDRDTLRKDPPDVLLTNYKMLDYLLIRPKDSKLWSKNKQRRSAMLWWMSCTHSMVHREQTWHCCCDGCRHDFRYPRTSDLHWHVRNAGRKHRHRPATRVRTAGLLCSIS